MQHYTILLFYKYVSIADPAQLMLEQRALCERLGITGRIIVACEGINATCEGTDEAIEEYLKTYLSDPRFANTHIKKSVGTGTAFPRLSIKVRNEIVTLGLPPEDDIDPNTTTGTHLAPETLHEWIREGKPITIVDMRNTYEHHIGHFANSILPPLENFRDLTNAVDTLNEYKDKTVVTVCTGGVRCEKASGFLVKKGFKDVYQLDGGIVSYMEKYKNDDFKGKLYVFDNRMAMTFTPNDQRTIVGRCALCRTPSEQIRNCSDAACHKQFICCEKCTAVDDQPVCQSCTLTRAQNSSTTPTPALV